MTAVNRKTFLTTIAKSLALASFSSVSNWQIYPSKAKQFLETGASGDDLFSSLQQYLVVSNYSSDDLMIYAFDLDMTQFNWSSNKNIAIYAYQLTLPHTLQLNGRNLFIHCNKLVTKSETKVFLNGLDGESLVDFREPPIQKLCNDSMNLPPGFRSRPPAEIPTKAKSADNVKDNVQMDSRPDGPINGKKGGDFYLCLHSIVGNVSIYSKGGSGSQGEEGQTGIRGCDGDNYGPPTKVTAWRTFGKPPIGGGDGALGGYGGDSGNGRIIIPDSSIQKSLTPLPTDTARYSEGILSFPNVGKLQFITEKGQQGPSGSAGKGGFHGGAGGSYGGYITTYGPGRQSEVSKDGVSPPNSHERDGNVRGTVLELNGKEHEFVPAEYAMLLLLKAESLYLNGEDKQAADILKYVNDLSSKAKADEFDGKPDYVSGYLKSYTPEEDLWTSIYQKSRAYLSQVKAGYDIFGNVPNYVSILDPDYLNSKFSKNAVYIDSFEETLVKTIQLSKEKKIEVSALKQFKNQCETTITVNENRLIDELKKIQSLNSSIYARELQVSERITYLNERLTEFNKAVAALKGGCSFSNVINFVASIVAFAGGVASGIGAIAGGAALIQTASDMYDNLEQRIAQVNPGMNFKLWGDVVNKPGKEKGPTVIGQLKEIGDIVDRSKSGLAKYRQAYTDYLAKNNSYGTPDAFVSPSNLLVVNKEDFDKMIAEYMNLIEAVNLRTEFYNFIEFADLTNKMKIELNARISNAFQLNESLKELKATQQQLTNALLEKALGDLSSRQWLDLFMLYYETKHTIIKTIYLQRKGLQYIRPATAKAKKYPEGSIKELLATHFIDNTNGIISEAESQGFKSDFTRTPIHLKWENYPISSRMFLKPDQLRVFEFQIDETLAKVFPRQQQNIRITGVLAKLHGIDDINKPVLYYLTHLGNSTLMIDKKKYSFSHLPQKATFNVTIQEMKLSTPQSFFGGNDTAGNRINLIGSCLNNKPCYLGIGPIASWQLSISQEENENLDVARINGLDLYFWYSYQSVVSLR